jgi:hypothetical protein
VKARRLVALATLLVLFAAACGRSDDSSSGGEPSATDGPSDTTGDGGEGEGLDAGGFGDLGVVCSEGEGEPEPVNGVVGIDGTTINIATFSDPGFAGRPGLNQEFFDTAEAVVDWCNDHGGVRGYQLKVDLRDAALTEYQPRILESCDADFFMVGGGAVFDDTGQSDRLECGLPDIAGFVVTPQAAGADLEVQPLPNPPNSLPVGDFEWIAQRFPGTTDNVGVFTGNLGTTLTVAERYKEAIGDLGWNVVYDDSYNAAGESNWRPFAQAMQEAGVEGLVWVGEPENLAALRQAMQDIGYEPQWVRTDANHYDENYIKVGGDAVGNTFVRTAFWPFERADENTATAQYLELMETYKPDGKFPALLAAQGLSAWMLFLTSAGECVDAGTLDRDCVFEHARDHTDWTGGGLHAPMSVLTRTAPSCFAVAEATPDGFVFPDVTDFGTDTVQDFYACDDSYTKQLTGNYGQGALCPSGVPDALPSECAG